MKPYDDLKDIPLQTLEGLFKALQAARVSPQDLYCYAKALDVLDSHKETVEDLKEVSDAPSWSVAEEWNSIRDDEYEDARDEAIAISDATRTVLVKMGHMEDEA